MKILIKLLTIAIWLSLTSVSYAEVVLDGTLGTNSGPLPGPVYLIGDNLGQKSGANLFHSFESFNINTGESATFTGPDSVSNIIGRVTGSDFSWIDGTLRSEILNANLYLLNPNGIMFGKNASLDINGSFHASTADYLRLKNGQNFYVNKSNDFSLMVAPPSSFGFLNNTPASITVDKSILQVPTRKTLSLIGGDLDIKNGGKLYAPDGKINLVSMASTGEVIPGLPNTDQELGTINLSHFLDIVDNKIVGYRTASLDTSGISGGEIFIQGGQFFSMGGYLTSKVLKTSYPSEVNIKQQPGKITLLVNKAIDLAGSNIAVDAEKGTNYDAGNIMIETGTLALNPSCPTCGISSDTSGTGNSGDITINASESLTITGSGISTISDEGDAGKAGNINLEVGQLTLNYGFLNSGTLGSGDSGNIDVNATKGISLVNNSLISGAIGSTNISGSGKGGNINIKAPRLEITDSSAVQTGAFSSSTGDAGDIQIDVDYLGLADRSTIISSNAGHDKSGKLSIVSNDIELNRSSIFLLTKGKYEAGSLNITADNISLFDNSFILSLADKGSGSYLALQARNQLYSDKSFILTRTYGSKESSGDIIAKAKDFMINDGQVLATGVVGDGGNMNIQANNINILGNGWIDVSSKYGVNGELIVNSVKLTDDFMVLPHPKIHGAKLSLNRCANSSLKETISKFIITIRDVSPPTPEDLRR